MNLIKCNNCATENEEKFIYCKNCGALLQQNDNNGTKNDFKPEGNANNFNTINTNSTFGISDEDLVTFLGKKGHDIIEKFKKMELFNSKTSWCWPVAILGLLFGPMGAALWFFYRKMYKPAVILSVIGAALSIITAVLTFNVNPVDFEAFISSIQSNDLDTILDFANSINQTDTLLSYIASILNDISSIFCCIYFGLFGFHMYKNHTVNKISQYKNSLIDNRYYKIGLSSIGGTSGGMLLLGIFVMVVINNLVTSVTAIFKLFL